MNDKPYRDPEAVKKLVQWLGEGHQALAELVDALHGTIGELEQDIRDRDLTIAGMTTQKDALEQKLQEQTRLADELSTQKDDLEQKLLEQDRLVADLNGQKDTLELKCREQDQLTAELTGQKETLEQKLLSQDQLIADLSGQKDTYASRCAELEKQLEIDAEQAKLLNRLIADYQAEAAALTAEKGALTAEITEMRKAIDKRNAPRMISILKRNP